MTKKKAIKEEIERHQMAARSQIVARVSWLCEWWASRRLSAGSTTESLRELYSCLMKAWAFELLHDRMNPLSADNLQLEVADSLTYSGDLSEAEIQRQCEHLGRAWRALSLHRGGKSGLAAARLAVLFEERDDPRMKENGHPVPGSIEAWIRLRRQSNNRGPS